MPDDATPETKSRREGGAGTLRDEQRRFVVIMFARCLTMREVMAAWRVQYPNEAVPTDEALRFYRAPKVTRGPWADLYRQERADYVADLPPVAERTHRIELLAEQVDSYRERIAACKDDERREVMAKTDAGFVKSIRATRRDLERDLREALAAVRDEMGRVSKVEVTGKDGAPVAVEFGHLTRAEVAQIVLAEMDARGEETEG